jgi:hypothetical protein
VLESIDPISPTIAGSAKSAKSTRNLPRRLSRDRYQQTPEAISQASERRNALKDKRRTIPGAGLNFLIQRRKDHGGNSREASSDRFDRQVPLCRASSAWSGVATGNQADFNSGEGGTTNSRCARPANMQFAVGGFCHS